MAMLFNCTTGSPYQAPEGFHAHMLVQSSSGSELSSPDHIHEQQMALMDQEQQLQMQQQAQQDLMPDNANLLIEMLEQQGIQDQEQRTTLRKEVKKENQRRFDEEMSM
ncbi:hypothetical protein [Marinobacterium sp. BA1]|uniref:hypothetical protein n=1 Tax=Marinobacterium sp. BA1 TaxID=3138931 RepID=UPI0032E76AD6